MLNFGSETSYSWIDMHSTYRPTSPLCHPQPLDFTACVVAEMVKWSTVWNPSETNTPRMHWDDHDINHPSPAHVLDFFGQGNDHWEFKPLRHYVTRLLIHATCLSLCCGSSSSKKGIPGGWLESTWFLDFLLGLLKVSMFVTPTCVRVSCLFWCIKHSLKCHS